MPLMRPHTTIIGFRSNSGRKRNWHRFFTSFAVLVPTDSENSSSRLNVGYGCFDRIVQHTCCLRSSVLFQAYLTCANHPCAWVQWFLLTFFWMQVMSDLHYSHCTNRSCLTCDLRYHKQIAHNGNHTLVFQGEFNNYGTFWWSSSWLSWLSSGANGPVPVCTVRRPFLKLEREGRWSDNTNTIPDIYFWVA